MTTDALISRGEFDMLAQRVTEHVRRLEEMDRSGTRGVGALALQVSELVKDVEKWQAGHDAQHQAEANQRKSARRWAWGWAFAALVALEAPLITLLAQHH